jgi:hypothetical protein
MGEAGYGQFQVCFDWSYLTDHWPPTHLHLLSAQLSKSQYLLAMPLLDLYRVVRDASRDKRNSLKANRSHLALRIFHVFLRTWDLGFTAFGGPPVHFKILRHRFVLGSDGNAPWIDEQTVRGDDGDPLIFLISLSFEEGQCA